MKLNPPALTSALQQGIAGLEDMDGLDVLKEPTWDAKRQRWIILCRFTVPSGSTWPLPVRTSWYVLIDPLYPVGAIKIYPAKAGGIVDTFPHQSLNLPAPDDSPWRTGDICVHEGRRALRRLGGTSEPLEAEKRLAWRMQKALEWVYAASRGDLNGPEDAFEIPDFGVSGNSVIGFSEDKDSFALWESISTQAGLATLYTPRLTIQPIITVVHSYQTFNGQNLYVPQWGTVFEPPSKKALEHCLWVRFPAVPHFLPWRAPATWGELIQLAQEMADLDLHQLIHTYSKYLRNQKPVILLCGFPIPAKIDGPLTEYFWQAVQLPKLASSDGQLRGFRNNEKNRKRVDRLSYRPNSSLVWRRSENWHPSTRSIRGQFSLELTRCRVLIIGGGALGSVIAELLVRGGVEHIVISDNEVTATGNLVRHTLILQDVRELKAQSLARRLNQASPHARVKAMGVFPPRASKDLEIVGQADLIIDCTGENEVLYSLRDFDWERPRIFYSCSLDWQARRSFCYYAWATAFPAHSFLNEVTPYLVEDSHSEERPELVREGGGCWHPIMPARIDDIWMLAAASVRQLDENLKKKCQKSGLVVFVRDETNGFSGVHRV